MIILLGSSSKANLPNICLKSPVTDSYWGAALIASFVRFVKLNRGSVRVIDIIFDADKELVNVNSLKIVCSGNNGFNNETFDLFE